MLRVLCRKFKLHLKPNICYGGFVRVPTDPYSFEKLICPMFTLLNGTGRKKE
jgi:hypothetical protein